MLTPASPFSDADDGVTASNATTSDAAADAGAGGNAGETGGEGGMGSVVLVAGPCPATNIIYHWLAAHGVTFAAVLLEAPVSPWGLLKRRAKKLGWATVMGQLAFVLGPLPWLEQTAEPRRREIYREFSLDPSPIPESLVRHVPTVNSPECRDALRELAPRVVVVNGTRIISQHTLDATTAPFINIHAGITPLYRGVHGGYWALATGHPESAGVTIHLIDKGIDTGAILYQALISPTAADNFCTYPDLQLAVGLPLLRRAISDAFASRLSPIPAPPGPSRLWSHPTLFQYFAHRRHHGAK